MNPHKHVVEISDFSLNHVFVRLTKIMSNLVKDRKLLTFKVIFLGLYRTSRPVRKSGKFSKSGLSGNRTFSFPDTGLLTLLKIEKKLILFQKKIQDFFFCLFIWSRSASLSILVNKMFEIISPDTVRSGRTCPVRKLICSVRLSPTFFNP
jgi:hypothetical protein